jgi:NAD(P)-dependent dehydrogenase (short-subunit alcohol dehydrogenase family)
MHATDAELADRRILVTGASRGLGLAVCREVAAQGAQVIGVARHFDPLQRAMDGLPGSGHTAHAMDVADSGAWSEMIEAVAQDGALHGLVTAAAVLGPIGRTEEVDPERVLETVRVDLLGTFLAVHHTIPLLDAAGDGAIVTFSGGGATSPMPRYDAYAMSKAGVVRLTEQLASGDSGVRANAVAPGFVATEMHEETLAAGEELAGPNLEKTRKALDEGGVPPERAGALTAMLLGPEADGISGRLISAPWDPWEDPQFRARLRAEPDLCTLRRIDGVFFGPLPGDEA